LHAANNSIAIKAGTYAMSSASANVSGGKVSISNAATSMAQFQNLFGWNANRHIWNTDSTRPTITAGAQTSLTVLAVSASYTQVANIDINGNSNASLTGLTASANYQSVSRCKVSNCTVIGLDVTTNARAMFCEATGCSGTAAMRLGNSGAVYAVGCESYSNTIHGILCGNGGIVVLLDSLTYGNSGASTDGVSVGSSCVGILARGCVAYGNGRHGFDLASSTLNLTVYENCIAEGNAGFGWNATAVRGFALLLNCAGYNNTSGNYTAANIPNVSGFVAQSAGSYFTNAASSNFALNSITGQGQLLRATGFPGVMPRGLTTGYADIGTAQHQDSPGMGVILG
jgi:hypothetical protein